MKLPVVANGHSAVPPQTNMFQVRLHPVVGSYHAAGTLPEATQGWTHQGAAVSTLDVTGWKQAVLAVRGGSIWSVFPAARHLHCRVRGSQGTVQSSVARPNDRELGRTLLFPSLVAFTTSDGPTDGYIEINFQPSGLGKSFPCYTLLYKFSTRGYEAVGHRERYSPLWLNDAPCNWEQMNPSALWLKLPKWDTPTSWSSPRASAAKPITTQAIVSSTCHSSGGSHDTLNQTSATSIITTGGDPRKLHPHATKLFEELDQRRDAMAVAPNVTHTAVKLEPQASPKPATVPNKQSSSKNKAGAGRPPWFEVLQKQGVSGLSPGQISKLRKIGLDYAQKGGYAAALAPSVGQQVGRESPLRQERPSGSLTGDLTRQNELLREKVEHMKLLKEQARLERELEEARDELAYGNSRSRIGDKRARGYSPVDDHAGRYSTAFRHDHLRPVSRRSGDYDDDDRHERSRRDPSEDRPIRPLPSRDSPPMSKKERKRERKLASIPPPGSLWGGWPQASDHGEQAEEPSRQTKEREGGRKHHRDDTPSSRDQGRIRSWSDDESSGLTPPREPAAPKKSVTATNCVPLAAASRWPKRPEPAKDVVTPPADGSEESLAPTIGGEAAIQVSSDPRARVVSPIEGDRRASSVAKERTKSSVDRALQPLEEGQITSSRPPSTPAGPRSERSNSGYDDKARHRLPPVSQYIERDEVERDVRRANRMVRRSSDAEN